MPASPAAVSHVGHGALYMPPLLTITSRPLSCVGADMCVDPRIDKCLDMRVQTFDLGADTSEGSFEWVAMAAWPLRINGCQSRPQTGLTVSASRPMRIDQASVPARPVRSRRRCHDPSQMPLYISSWQQGAMAEWATSERLWGCGWDAEAMTVVWHRLTIGSR